MCFVQQIVHRVSKKRPTYGLHYNYDTHEQILAEMLTIK